MNSQSSSIQKRKKNQLKTLPQAQQTLIYIVNIVYENIQIYRAI
jgi:hypothetical protein